MGVTGVMQFAHPKHISIRNLRAPMTLSAFDFGRMHIARLECPLAASLCRAIFIVIVNGSKEEMVRAHACAVIAVMKHA